MPAAPLPVFTCIDCGDTFARKIRGATPKRCEDCKRIAFKGGRTRGDRPAAQPGPILSVREVVVSANPELRIRSVAAGLAVAVGMNDDLAESIVAAIDTLIAQGETPLEIRIRLNPNPAGFGKRAATDPAAALRALLHEDEDDEEDAA